jgi:hypothetical protein
MPSPEIETTGSGGGSRRVGTPDADADAFLQKESALEGYEFPLCFQSEDAAHAAAANRYTGAALETYREVNWRVFENGSNDYSFTYPSVTAVGATTGRMPTDRNLSEKYISGGHAHWDGNTDFSGWDWRWVTGNNRKFYLSAGDGRLQYSTRLQAQPYGTGPGSRNAPSTYPGKTVRGIDIRSTFP